MGYAGFWSIRHGTGSETVSESDCPVFQTSSAWNKVADMLGADRDTDKSESGGGRQAEAVYWFASHKTQWRVRGKCYVIAAHDIDQDPADVAEVKAKIQSRMRHVSNDSHTNDREYAWANEVERRFDELPQGLKVAFGTECFRLCILVPDEVEQMDASVLETSNTRLWRSSEDSGDLTWTLVHDSMKP